MTSTLCVINNKGGVGKTTSVCSFAEVLASLNKKVLVVDTDPQANSSQLFGCYNTYPKTVSDLFLYKGSAVTKDNIAECIQETDYENIDIISSDVDFAFTVEKITYDTTRIQQKILEKALSQIKDGYDYIIIDSSPYFNIITQNALCASNYVLTPVENDGFGYAGLTKLLGKIYEVKDELNPDLNFLGVYMTKVNQNTILFKELYEAYIKELGDKFFRTYIHQDNKAKESITEFIPLLHYSPKCKAAVDYRKLILEMDILSEMDSLKLHDDIRIPIK